MTQSEFVQRYWPLAVKVTQGTKIMPGTVITAAGVESGWGNSKLASQYNNFFGFTADNTPNVRRIYMCNSSGTDCHYYKVYNSPLDSFKDYVRLLMSYPRYNAVRQADTVEDQIKALGQSGYATNPNYGSILLRAWNEVSAFVKENLKSPGLDLILLAGVAFFIVWLMHR